MTDDGAATGGGSRARKAQVLFLHLPSPPGLDLLRDLAGGFAIALRTDRARYGHDGTTMPHLALVYAFTAAVRAGMDATYLDAHVEDLDLPAVVDRSAEIGPEVVVSSVSLAGIREDLALLGAVKERTGATIVAAGTACRVLTEEVLSRGCVDVAVTGDVEEVGTELLGALLDGTPLEEQPGIARAVSGAVVSTPDGRLGTLDALPVPAFERLPMSGYRNWEFGLSKSLFGRQYGPLQNYFPVYLSRGCPFACRYCPYPVGHGTRQLIKATDQALEEFARLAALGVRNVALRDQVLPIESGALERFCVGLERLGLGMRWTCEARVGSLEPGLLALMRRAGCFRIHYGVETGDADVFVLHAKRGIAHESVGSCFAATRAAGIDPASHFMIGFAEDDWDSIGRTVRLVRELRIVSGDCSVLTPYPGTRGHEEAVAEGRLTTGDWRYFTGSDPIARCDHMSPVELLVARAYVLQTLAGNRRTGLSRALSSARRAVRRPAALEFDPMPPVQRFLAERADALASRDGRGAVAAAEGAARDGA